MYVNALTYASEKRWLPIQNVCRQCTVEDIQITYIEYTQPRKEREVRWLCFSHIFILYTQIIVPM